jgi:peptidyl-prolyl cis-trans isomerase SurA
VERGAKYCFFAIRRLILMSEERNYRWPAVVLAGLCLVLWLVGGCGDEGKSGLTESELARIAVAQKIELVKASGGLVLMVGGEPITSDEIIKSPAELDGAYVSPLEHLKASAQASTLEQFKKQARGGLESAVMSKISETLLYQYAKRQAGTGIDESLDKAAETELRKFVLGFGGDEAKADETLKQRGMDRKIFKERRKRSMLIQSYVASKMPRYQPATYRELVDCYNQMKDKFFSKPAQIRFRLIDIEPAKLDITDPNQDRLEEARRLAGELVGRIKAGEDFGTLAGAYSHGLWREAGGLWQPIQPGSLASPYDVLAAEAEKIEPGQIAGPIETPEHIFIMKLEEKQPASYEPFEKVQRQVENKVLSEQRSEVVDRLEARLREQAGLGKTDEFVDFCLEKIYQMNN